MIIGETFKGDYDGYEEENYDYLFKRKSKEERQQRKADNKQKRSTKKQGRQEKRLEKKAGTGDTPKKHPILGNFGLFNKNKKKEKEKANSGTSNSASGSSGKKEGGNVLDALQEKAAGLNIPGSESAAETEGAKLESKELEQNGKPKEAGFGPMVGFAFLGITILLAGYAIFKADKKPISQLQPMKVAA